MTCQELVEFLSGYLANELPTTQKVQFEEHLLECPDCRAYMQSYRTAVEAGKIAFKDLADHADAIPDELVQAILALKK